MQAPSVHPFCGRHACFCGRRWTCVLEIPRLFNPTFMVTLILSGISVGVSCGFFGVGVWRFDSNMLPTHLIHSENPHHHHLANIACGGADNKTLFITESLSGDILTAPLPVAGKKMFGLT